MYESGDYDDYNRTPLQIKGVPLADWTPDGEDLEDELAFVRDNEHPKTRPKAPTGPKRYSGTTTLGLSHNRGTQTYRFRRRRESEASEKRCLSHPLPFFEENAEFPHCVLVIHCCAAHLLHTHAVTTLGCTLYAFVDDEELE